jgi:hypothetical protein
MTHRIPPLQAELRRPGLRFLNLSSQSIKNKYPSIARVPGFYFQTSWCYSF